MVQLVNSSDIERALLVYRHLGNNVVYRGVPDSVLGDIDNLIGGTFQDNGFVSTTLDKETPGIFGKTVMKIRVPKGAKGAFIDTIGKRAGGDKPENELLLPRGSKFRIISAQRQGNRTNVEAELVL